MIDNLKDAINRTREKAKTLKQRAIELRENKHPIFSHVANDVVADNYLERAEYNEQIASWLEELDKRREADTWNVIHTEADLPKEDGFYLTTVEYVESISGKLKQNTAELYFSTVFKSWSECGEDEDSDDDIIAWKPMPKPYESEATNE